MNSIELTQPIVQRSLDCLEAENVSDDVVPRITRNRIVRTLQADIGREVCELVRSSI